MFSTMIIPIIQKITFIALDALVVLDLMALQLLSSQLKVRVLNPLYAVSSANANNPRFQAGVHITQRHWFVETLLINPTGAGPCRRTYRIKTADRPSAS